MLVDTARRSRDDGRRQGRITGNEVRRLQTMLAEAWWLPIVFAPLIGSFLGVLVTRLPRGLTVVWGRSACPQCGHTLGPVELVPLAGWAMLGGRCRHCSERISLLYPVLEIGAIAVAVTAVAAAQGWVVWASCGLGWSLLALAVIDGREGVLPDVLTLPLIPAGLVVAYLEDRDTLYPHAIGAIAGFVAFALIRLAYRAWRGREGMGAGDAKLFAASGAWVAWEGLPSVVLIAALASLAWIAAAGLKGRQPTLATALPFGPGLCLGTWVIWLFGPLF
ncbi:MAG TPA: A24 family peptidase [Stellaceae bacterium]|nr:A24 family peptidase [Stellaceae bacterium]